MVCPTPIFKKGADGQRFFFPCGKCAACINRRSNDLVLRALNEYSKAAHQGVFVTLTYSNEFLPNYPSKVHLQNFFKRLRITLSRYTSFSTFKYLAVSELGSRTNRLHYHVLIFGVPFNLIYKGKPANLSYLVHAAWGMGFTDVSQLRSERGVIYTIKYTSKSFTDKLFFNKDSETLLLLSKGFGAPTSLQLSVIRRKIHFLRDYYFLHSSLPDDFSRFTLRVGSRNFAIPRYFRSFLSEHDNALYSALVSKYIDSVSKPEDFVSYSHQYQLLYSRMLRSRTR